MTWNNFDDWEKMMRRRMGFLMRRMWEPIEEEIGAFTSFPVDISESEDYVIVKADLPGFKKEEISIKVTENTIEISAQHKEKKFEKTEKMYRAERKFGAMRRFLTLPTKVDYVKTEAKFEDGILTVKLKKKEKKKIGKEIKIS